MDLFAFDDDYVRRLKEGDRKTQDHFHVYFRDLLLPKLRKRLGPQQAMDALQEVFARVLSKLPEVRDGRKFGAFVNSVCNHVLMESYRQGQRNGTVSDAKLEPAIPADFEERLIKKERRARVRRVLGTMEKRDRLILRAIFFDDDDKDEICRKFGVDRQYLRVLVHRATKKFRSFYGPKSTPPF